MRTERNRYLKQTHPLLIDWLDPAAQAEDAYRQMLSLEQTRDQALQMLPSPQISPRQQHALDILARQQALELQYQQRCRALQSASLAPYERDRLLRTLQAKHLRTRQRLMIGWPTLTGEEYEALPLLHMRQSLEQDIEQRLETLRIELNYHIDKEGRERF